jgi:hypothetical protein
LALTREGAIGNLGPPCAGFLPAIDAIFAVLESSAMRLQPRFSVRRAALCSMFATLAVCGLFGCDRAANSETASKSGSAPAWATPTGPAARLIGLWVAGEHAADADDEKAVRMERAIAECSFKFDFRDAQKVFIQLGRDVEVEQGSWQLVRGEGDALVIRIASASCGDMEFAVNFLDDNRFTMQQIGAAHDALAFTLTRLRGAS